MDTSNASSDHGRRSKVARLIDEYNLQGLGPELEQLWTADENRRSLRELAEYFNNQLLETAVEDVDIQFLDGELENSYRLLTDDDVSSADRNRIRRRLKRDGVDVDKLESDFVTYQAIRSYLKDTRNAEYTPDTTNPIAQEKTNIKRLRGRMTSVTDGKLEQLRSRNIVDLGEFHTLANIQVICEDCNAKFDVLELLERGGCNCSH
jgi:hypothetical protein